MSLEWVSWLVVHQVRRVTRVRPRTRTAWLDCCVTRASVHPRMWSQRGGRYAFSTSAAASSAPPRSVKAGLMASSCVR